MNVRFPKIIDGLFYLFIFFIPFTGTAVINVEAITFGLQPSYLIIMIIMYTLSCFLLINRVSLNRSVIKNKPVIIFSLICLMNIASAFQGIYAPLSKNSLESPIIVSLKSSVYFIFFLPVFITIILYTRNKENFIKTLKLYVFAAIFPIFWGLVQLFCFFTGKEYPMIFNNNLSSSQNVGFVIGKLFPRVCSVAQEPSMFALYMITIIAVTSYIVLEKESVSGSKILDRVIFILSIFMLFLSSSMSGFSAFLLLVLLLIIFSSKRSKILNYIIVILLLTNFVVLYLGSKTGGTNYYTAIYDRLNRVYMLTDKSAVTRSDHFIAGLKVFLDHPFIGVGERNYGFYNYAYATVEGNKPFPITHNFISSRLAEHGVIGGILWVAFFFYIYYHSLIIVNRIKDPKFKKYSIAVILASLVSNFSILMFQDSLQFLQFFLLNAMVINIQYIYANENNKILSVKSNKMPSTCPETT